MKKKLLFIVPMVAVVLSGCYTRGGKKSSSSATSSQTTSSSKPTSSTSSSSKTSSSSQQEKALASVAIGGDMTKKSYYLNDEWDMTGLTFTGTYTDGSSADISSSASITFTPAKASTAGENQKVKVKCELDGKSDEKEITGISVSSETKVITNVTIKTAPTKVTYNAGDKFDPTGLEVTLTYEDGSSSAVTYAGHQSSFSFTPTLETSLTSGVTEVVIVYDTYTSYAMHQAITVKESGESSIETAYKAAIAAGGNATETKYTFSGVYTGRMANGTTWGFYLQEGEYAMYVYGVNVPEGAAVGKVITVESKVINRNKTLPQTYYAKDTDIPEIIGTPVDGTPITPASVNSQSSINALNVNALVSCAEVEVTQDLKDKVATWANDKSVNPNVTVGSDSIVINFDKSSFNACGALKTQIAGMNVGDKFALKNAVVRKYGDKNQFGIMDQTVLETAVDPIQSVSISTQPTKKSYTEGLHFDPTGLEVNVHHESGANEVVKYSEHASDFGFTPSLTTALQESDTSVAVTYKGVSAGSVSITVTKKTATSAKIKTSPSKVTYSAGEKFNPSGLVVTVTYSDSSTDTVAYVGNESSFTFTPSLTTALQQSDKSVSVTYSGLSAGSVAITVQPASEGYTKVTSNLSDWTGTYLLVYEASATEARVWTGVDGENTYVAATIASGKIASKPTGTVEIIVAKYSTGYSLKVSGGDNNGKYLYHTGSKNTLNFSASQEAVGLSYSESTVVDGGSEYVLRYNSNSGQDRFRFYKGTQQAIHFYKLGA